MPTLQSPYKAPSWCPGGNLQTVIPARFSKKPTLTYHREILSTPDGDIVAWDWMMPAADALHAKTPVLVHFHGLEGSSQSHYALALMAECKKRGWIGVVPHYRTCGDVLNIKPRAYHAGDTVDCLWVLRTIKSRYPDAPMYVTGVSLGGNQMSKCLGELGAEAIGLVEAAVSICAPIDLLACSIKIGRGVNVLYERMFLDTLKKKYVQKCRQFPDLFDIKRVEHIKTMYDFDEIFTSKVHHYASAYDYWTACSCKAYLKEVRVPLLFMNAQNDPFIPASVLPVEKDVSASVSIEISTDGGHVGFPTGKFPGVLAYIPWRVMKYLDEVCGL